MTKQTIDFKAEVAKVLDIVIHSLYSHKEIFLRELISNANDACDKLRYAALLHPELTQKDGFKITITPDQKAGTLTIHDNGIGMDKDELINNLGTIARSGSAEFLKTLSGDKQKDMNLIGQFGVGFYASFMVADRVTVHSLKAGDKKGFTWESDGLGSFTVSENATLKHNGTSVILHLKKEDRDFLDAVRIRYLVRQYSDYIAIPIYLNVDGKEEIINDANALWTKPKSEITPEQYKNFYQSVSHAFDAPWMTLHYKAEGAIEYTGLMFIPTKPPFNLFQPDRKSNIQLYVNRVFISDDVPELMPYFLRFVCGVIDTKDLPLNVSREMLQHTPVLGKIKTGITRRILSELKKRTADPKDYETFWNSFGIVLKEGLYEPNDYRKEVAELCRFHATQSDGLISFADYVAGMKQGQKNIYFITGNDLNTLKNNPQLEGFNARGVNVLLLTDPIDEFWIQTFNEFDGKKIVSVMHAGDDIQSIKPTDEPTAAPLEKEAEKTLIDKIKTVLAGKIGDVRATDRLTKSALALITPAGQMSMHLEHLMKANGQTVNFASERIVEINPRHPIMHKLAEMIQANKSEQEVAETITLLFETAQINEGETLSDPADYMNHINALLLKSLG